MAPARASLRAGAIAVLVLAACDGNASPEGPSVLELAHDTIRLEQGVRLHDVAVSRGGSEFEPSPVEAATGDVVRFTAGDGAGHAIVFDGGGMGADVRAWLERTAQMRGPPLLAEGSAWVITLDGAPPGEYPFRCATHGVVGVLSVRSTART